MRCSAINKSQQCQEKNSWECRESHPGRLSEKQVCYLCAMQPPPLIKFFLFVIMVSPESLYSAELVPYIACRVCFVIFKLLIELSCSWEFHFYHFSQLSLIKPKDKIELSPKKLMLGFETKKKPDPVSLYRKKPVKYRFCFCWNKRLMEPAIFFSLYIFFAASQPVAFFQRSD